MERPPAPADPFAAPAAHPDVPDLADLELYDGDPGELDLPAIPEHLDPEADLEPGASDWLPLLTHPIGGQRFQPDVEAAPGPLPDRPAEDGQARRPRNGHAHRGEPHGGPTTNGSALHPAPVDDRDASAGALTGVTTWLDPIIPPDPAEASALAGAFAADYLSWDQDNPDRRGLVLAQYLPSDVSGDASLLGWSGTGRQRAEISLPGAVQPDGEGRVMVDVRVRVTPFRKAGQPARAGGTAAAEDELEVAGVPAVAPAPTARGWKSLDSHWVRLTVPVTRERGRLVVDTWDEQLDPDDEPSADHAEDASAPDGDEHREEEA
jgi:hypothetical protein